MEYPQKLTCDAHSPNMSSVRNIENHAKKTCETHILICLHSVSNLLQLNIFEN